MWRTADGPTNFSTSAEIVQICRKPYAHRKAEGEGGDYEKALSRSRLFAAKRLPRQAAVLRLPCGLRS